jgi:hypothetical protein
MSATFASQEWAASLAGLLREDARVRTESVTWVFGPVLLVVDPDAEHGFDGAALLLDLHEGDLRGISLVELQDEQRMPFAIGGSLARWKAMFGGQLAIIDGILESKLRVRGDLPTLVRHRALLEAITRVGATVATSWQDEAVEATTAG